MKALKVGPQPKHGEKAVKQILHNLNELIGEVRQWPDSEKKEDALLHLSGRREFAASLL